jgi:predicted nucleic acid-binding protein
LTDAISFAVMRRLRLPVAFTFDDDFAQAGFGDLRQILRP